MGLNEVAILMGKYGERGTIITIALFFLINFIKSDKFKKIITVLSDILIEKFKKSKINKSIKMITESDVTHHDIFNYIDFWTNSKIPIFTYSTEYRTAVFRKYLKLYLKSYKSNLYDFINSGNWSEMNQSELSTSLLNLLNKIIFDYEKESLEVGIPRIVIEKMKIKNNSAILLTIDLINGVCSSQFYESEKNLLKIYSILNIILSVLESTISNSKTVCDGINGQLKGMKFTDSNGDEFTEPS